jgi:hypothetical protein
MDTDMTAHNHEGLTVPFVQIQIRRRRSLRWGRFHRRNPKKLSLLKPCSEVTSSWQLAMMIAVQWLLVLAASFVHADHLSVHVSDAPISGRVIASDFVSFSFEVTHATDMLTFHEQPRPTLVHLMQQLQQAAGNTRGPNVRIGGDSTDESVWVPSPSPLPTNDTFRLSIKDIIAYASVVPLWNGTISPGLNFREPHNPMYALAHLKALVSNMKWADQGGILEAIEIGNEPDLYWKYGVRNSSFTYANYDEQFSGYLSAITPMLPSQKRIQGATFCCFYEGNISSYMREHRTQLSSFSQHQYSLRNCGHPKTNPNTIFDLLNNSASTDHAAHVSRFVKMADRYHIPYFIGEGNSVACGGQWNVSDTMAAALWAIDTLFEHASVGVQRWNFHMGPDGAYSGILYPHIKHRDTPQVQPLYYAMLLASHAIANQTVVLQTEQKSTNSLIKAHAVRDMNNNVRVVLVHKFPNATSASEVCISLDGDFEASGTLTRLLAPSAHSTSGLTFANQTYDNTKDGFPVGVRQVETVWFDKASNCFKIELPIASAALFEVKSI